jgi:predicted sulfurtransferase
MPKINKKNIELLALDPENEDRIDTEAKVQKWVDNFIKNVDEVDQFLLDKLTEYEKEFDKMAVQTNKKLIKLGFEEEIKPDLEAILEERPSAEYTKDV